MKVTRKHRHRRRYQGLAVVLLLAAIVPAQDAPPVGALSGRVVAGREERPVVGAYVWTRSRLRPSKEGVFSGADGTFRLAGLEPGEYYVSARKTGFVAESLHIAVEAEQTVSDLELRMVPLGVVTGTVRDVDGDPVVGARVWSYRHGGNRRGGWTWRRHREDVTDDRGVYRLWPLYEGRYLIAVEARAESVGPGHVRLAHGPAFYPDATSPSQAQAVELLVGQQLKGVDVTVPSPAGSAVLGSVMLGPGLTESEGGEHCKNCGFLVYQSAGADFFLVAQSQAGPGGSFQLEGLLSGEYLFGFSDYDQRTEGDLSARHTITLDRDGRAELSVVLRPGVPLAVRTTLVAPPDELHDADDPENAPVLRLTPIGVGMHRAYEPQPNPPGQNLGFRQDRIAPGRYRVAEVRFPGGRFAGLRTDGREVAPPVIEVVDSARQRDYEILIAFDSGEIRGEVEFEEPRPGTILFVVAWPLDDSLSLEPSRTDISAGVPFELRPLAPGRYEVFAGSPRAMSRLSDPQVRAKVASRGARVEVKANETATVNLKALMTYDLLH